MLIWEEKSAQSSRIISMSLNVAYHASRNLPYLSGNLKIRFFNPGKEPLRLKYYKLHLCTKYIRLNKEFTKIAIFREHDTMTSISLFAS